MILNNNTQDFTMSARAEVQSIYLFIYLFIILPHTMNYKQNKNDNK